MAPGLDSLPSAAEVDVTARVDRFTRALSARVGLGIRIALLAIEWSTFPRRFSKRSLADRTEAMARWERSRLSLRQDMLMLAKLLVNVGYASDRRVRAAIGETSRCAVEGERPDPAPPLGDTVPPESGEECEVAVIGSGAGGAVAAAILAEAGHDVLILEAGDSVAARDYPDEPIVAVARLYRDGGLTVAEGRPMIPVPVGRVVGGTTVINSGTCFRAPDAVLRTWAEECGVDWAPDLDREFSDAERFLRVTPVDPDRMGRNGQLAMEGARRLGASGGPITRNAGHCYQCGSCPIGCPIGAKQSMQVSYLPRAVAAGARLRAGVRVDRLTGERGRIDRLECTVGDAGGSRPFTVRAKRVVLAGGALGTPELLLRSGLGGNHVGRHLRVHPACWLGARYPEDVRGWDGIMQSWFIDEWKAQGILLEATFTPLAFGGAWLPGTGEAHQRALLDFDRVGSIGVHLADRSSGRVRLSSDGVRLGYRLTAEDARRLQFGIARAAEVHFAAGAEEVYPNLQGLPVMRPDDLPHFEAQRLRPSRLRLEAFHPMGTARIDADPARGVCGVDGAVHGTTGLYIADASLFPGSLGVNPMMTVIAFASRIAADLSRRS